MRETHDLQVVRFPLVVHHLHLHHSVLLPDINRTHLHLLPQLLFNLHLLVLVVVRLLDPLSLLERVHRRGVLRIGVRGYMHLRLNIIINMVRYHLHFRHRAAVIMDIIMRL